MAAERDTDGENARAARLFIVSPGRHDELAHTALAAGWTVDGGDDAVTVVDARDAPGEALAAAGRLARRGGMLVLVSRGDGAALDRAFTAGASHFVVDPTTEEFVQALRFAGRRPPPRRRREETDAHGGLEEVRRWAAGRLAEGQPVSVVRAAFARFDIVNAAYGRERGDAMLAEAAGRLVAVAADLWGTDGLAARTTGAEFALAGDAARAGAERAAAAAAGALARPFGDAALGSRLGSATSIVGDDAAAVLRRADDAMRRAGEGGGVVHAPPERGAPPDELAADLHRALLRDEVTVAFQPQAEVATGRVVGAEALARWNHPRLGPLGAGPLFAAAARGGLEGPLSDHIRDLVLERAAAWPPALAQLRVSLNVVAADLSRPDFAQRLLAAVAASGFPAERLTIEVTETGLIADLSAASALLATLRAAGCRTAIDDFGTGYSSLAYLQSLPLDYLKLDRALVQYDGGRVVAAGTLTMARSLGLVTVAEGVETEEQRSRLAEEGCDLYQGFLCAGVLDEAALVRLVEESRCCPD